MKLREADFECPGVRRVIESSSNIIGCVSCHVICYPEVTSVTVVITRL